MCVTQQHGTGNIALPVYITPKTNTGASHSQPDVPHSLLTLPHHLHRGVDSLGRSRGGGEGKGEDKVDKRGWKKRATYIIHTHTGTVDMCVHSSPLHSAGAAVGSSRHPARDGIWRESQEKR